MKCALGLSCLMGAASLCLSSCRSELNLLWPDVDGLRSAVMISTGPARIEAQPIEAVLRFEEAESAQVLLYRHSLEELGLEPGSNPLGVPCRSCLLAAPAVSYRVDSGEAGEEQLVMLPAGPGEATLETLVTEHRARCARCPKLEPKLVPVELSEMGARLRVLPWSPGEALVHGYPDFVLWTVSLEAGLTELCRSEAFGLNGASFRDASDHLWLATNDGRVVALDAKRIVRGAPCDVATATVTEVHPGSQLGPVWLAGGPTEEGTEMYGLVSNTPPVPGGNLVHWRNGRWSFIEAQIPTVDQSQRLDWLAAGRAVALSGQAELYEIEDQTSVTTHTLSDARGLAVNLAGMTVRRLPGLGVVIGTRDHLLWRWQDDRFESLDEITPTVGYDRVESVANDEDGVFFTVRNGGIRWWYPDHGYCERQDLMADGSYKSIAGLGPRRWALGGNHLYLLEPGPEIRRCE